MDVGGFEPPIHENREGFVHSCKHVQPRDSDRRVDESIFKVGVARKELRLQETGVGHAPEEGNVDAVGCGHVLEGNRLKQRHVESTATPGDGKDEMWCGRS